MRNAYGQWSSGDENSLGEYHYMGYSIPSHMLESIDLYLQHGCPPGSFLYAVLCNNLTESVARADTHNIHNLPAYAAFLYNEMPRGSWGSEEKVGAWLRNIQASKEAEQHAQEA